MSTHRFFGYGSLVNTATHDYPNAHKTTVKGWARMWRHTDLRDVAFLTAVPDATCQIDGLSADVPNGDWAALDLRETGYDRLDLESQSNTAIYAVPATSQAAPSVAHPILLSYLDVVVQVYLNEFGEAGAVAFFETTRGWDAPILDDRRAPIYPRHQVLTAAQTGFVDDALTRLGCRIICA